MTCRELRILEAMSSITSVAPSATCEIAELKPSFTNTVLRTALGHDALDLPRRQYVVQHDRDVKT